MEIADIFIRSSRHQRGEQMLNLIRDIEAGQDSKNKIKTIYQDTQNVHDGTLNANVKKVCQYLIKHTGALNFDKDQVVEELKSISKKAPIYDDAIVDKTLDRIIMETTIFESFTLYQLFSNIWQFIITHKNKEDIQLRLIEELHEMHNYCTTGHLSRLINTIQGYSDDPELQIKISSVDQIKSSVKSYINKCIESAPEDIMDNMLDEDNTKFLTFVISLTNKNIDTWVNDYGEEVKSLLADIVKDYTGSKKIEFVNGRLRLMI
jgi:hypothetical protein